jgi:DNA-binding transcriptional LysR family regulator
MERMHWIDRIGRRVRLRDLHIFLTVANVGTMGRAAAALSVSQPVISKSVSELEAALRVRLFDRSARGIALTTYGAAMMECGRAVFDELHKGIKTIDFLGDPSGGSLDVGCTEFGAMGLVPLVIERLVARHPRLEVHVTTADPTSLVSVALPQRLVEVAVGAIPAELPADIEAEQLFDDNQVVMAGRRSRWTRRSSVRLADLVDAPWVLPPAGSSARANIDAAFVSRGLSPPVAQVSTFSTPLCHQLLASGKYLAILPRGASLLARHLPIRPLKVDFAGITRPVGIMTLRGRTASPSARSFIEAARMAAEAVSGKGASKA